MTNIAPEISEALRLIPVSWLAYPALAAAAALPGTRDAEQPRFAPLAAAAIGVAVGAGIQIGAQQLRKSTHDIRGLTCTLTLGEIERNASSLYTDPQATGKDGVLSEIAEGEAVTKVLPVAAAAFLAGVATGAAAAR